MALANTCLGSFSQTLALQDEAHLRDQRESYQQALDLLYKGKRDKFIQQASALADYPLYPYLKYREYRRYIETVTRYDLERFSQEFADTPYVNWLRKRWIKNLSWQKDWETYLAEYHPGEYDAEFDCYYYWAQYKVGSRDLAFQGAKNLWLVGNSQHEACDPLFEVWKTTGAMEGDLSWQRTQLAMANSRLQLASYLENHIPKEQRPIAREWRRLYRNPERLNQVDRYLQWGDDAKPLIVTGFSRLIRKDEDLAQALWPEYVAQFNFTQEERAKVAYEFAFVLGIRRKDNAKFWLDQSAANAATSDIIPLGIRHALYERDWPRVQRWISMLDPESAHENTWQYWLARSEQRNGEFKLKDLAHIHIDRYRVDVMDFHKRFLGALHDSKQTIQLFPESVIRAKFLNSAPTERLQKIAAERNFYGFLASDLIGQPLNLNQAPSVRNVRELHRIAELPAVKRAQEFFWHGDIYLAKSEWHRLIKSLDRSERSTLAQLANLWGWYNSSIVAAYQSEAYDDLDIRFPLAYSPVIAKHANQEGIALDWVYSLIRQESAFLPQAHSPVGAMGMMQIMPGTARQLSNSLGLLPPSRSAMLQPETNVRLGTRYMGQLLDQFNGNIILATAAYNAGPHRAKAWQPKYLPVSGDLWIETIPYSETRDYVKNILTYQAIYRYHLGKEAQLSEALSLIPARRLQSTAQR